MSNEAADIWKYLTPVFVSAVSLAVGWWLKGNEAHDKELEQRIDDIVAELEEVEQLAIAAWSSKKTDNVDEIDSAERESKFQIAVMQIEGRLHRVACLSEDIADQVPEYPRYEIPVLLVNLRRACTDDGEGSQDFSLPPAPLRIKTVIQQSTQLLRAHRMMRRTVMPRSGVDRVKRIFRIDNHSRQPKYWDH